MDANDVVEGSSESHQDINYPIMSSSSRFLSMRQHFHKLDMFLYMAYVLQFFFAQLVYSLNAVCYLIFFISLGRYPDKQWGEQNIFEKLEVQERRNAD